jgi:proline dehydrogenase
MEKERARAEELNYPSPIQPNKKSCDEDYNAAVAFCVENYKSIASCVASHNEYSTQYQLELMDKIGVDRKHPHFNFCQLYGMSDNLTFNLAKEGYNVAKYVPYGPVRDVIPYLIRRAQENSAVDGEVSRELNMIKKELLRRKK